MTVLQTIIDGRSVSAFAAAIAASTASRSFTSLDVQHVPAVRLEARAGVVGVRERRSCRRS